MFNKHDLTKDRCMLTGSLKRKGYDWWWHSFTGFNKETNEKKQFFIEFFIINPKYAKDKPTFGSLGEKPSYLMIKAGCWGVDHLQLHRFISLNDAEIHYEAPYSIKAFDCFASDNVLKGSINVTDSKNHPEYMCDDGCIEFDIDVKKCIAFNVGYGTNKLFTSIKAFEMYWHAEGMKSLYSGTIKVNGVEYIVSEETSNGYADKNWGRNFTSPWIWLSSNNLYSNVRKEKLENSVFDIGGGRPKVYFAPLKNKLLGALYLEGDEYEFNFSKILSNRSKTKFDCKILEDLVTWYIELENKTHVLIINATCEKKDMLLVNYESPDGKHRHNNLYNGGNGKCNLKLYKKDKKNRILIDDIDAIDVGCEFGEYDK